MKGNTVGAAAAHESTIRFEAFELDLSRQTLSRGSIRLKIQKQPLQVLALLIQRAPEVVSRDQIRQHVWGDDVYINVESNINFCVRQIRSVLGETSGAPRFVETLPRQGYRFIASVEGIRNQKDDSGPPTPQPSPKLAARRWWMAGLAAIAVFAIALGVRSRFVKQDTVSSVVRLSPITTYPGDEREPSPSPDGREVAFSWDGEGGGTRHIYILPLGEQHPVRLTQGPAEDSYPAWSPAGNQIAFIRRRDDPEADIMLVPAVGGAERLLKRIRFGGLIGDPGRILAWSPDGRWLCFPHEIGSTGHYVLFLLSLESGEARPLFSRQTVGIGDSSPAFSPDGHWLAFARFIHSFNSQLLLQRLSPTLRPDGEPLPVRDAGVNPRLPVWMPDSKKLLFLDMSRTIMQAGVDGAPARQFYVTDTKLEGLAMVAPGPTLVASRHEDDQDIWTIPLNAGGLTVAGTSHRIVHSTATEEQPYFSPDGRWLSFISHRTGAAELWLAAADGNRPRQLTHLSAYIVGYPRWSPDSKFIAFHARHDEAQIYVTRIEDGVTRQITRGLPESAAPSWSMDGQSLYITRHQDGRTHLCRMSVQGGMPLQLWDEAGAAFSMAAPGRQLLLYEKPDDRLGIYARSLTGDPAKNPELRLVSDYSPERGGFYPVNDGVYYTGSTPGGIPRAFRFYSFSTRKSVDVAPVPRNLGFGLTLTPNRTRLAYVVHAFGSEDLVQIELKR